MNKAQAIKLKCLDCACSQKEVTLCHIVDCPLWQFRFGYSMNDQKYSKRMEAAKKRYPKDYGEMEEARADYLEGTPNLSEFEQIGAVSEKRAA